MAYKVKDYRQVGALWYPVIIHESLIFGLMGLIQKKVTLEVIDEPKNERELRDMLIEETINRTI